jgi:hypothetical protein
MPKNAEERRRTPSAPSAGPNGLERVNPTQIVLARIAQMRLMSQRGYVSCQPAPTTRAELATLDLVRRYFVTRLRGEFSEPLRG